MIWLAIASGVIIGAATLQAGGAVIGGLLAYILIKFSELHKRLDELNKRLTFMERVQENTAEPKVTLGQSENKSNITENLNVDETDHTKSESPASQRTEPEDSESPKLDANPKRAEHLASTPSAKEYPIDKAINIIKPVVMRYFTEGNIIVRVAMVVLFFGFSFLVKYGIDNALVPIELRLITITMAAIALLAFSWKIRERRIQYALALQGGSIAILYLVTYASFRLYELLPAQLCFLVLVALSFFGMSLAVLQNSRNLAISAILGGFISPILTSTGSGSHIALFTYYLVLNLAIFGVSWFKSWRVLNLIGFAFTFVVGALWGVTQYQAKYFASTEPFLIAFFILYVFIAILFAGKRAPELKAYVDGTLIFGTPLLGFGLQTSIVHHYPFGLAISALALGAFYLATAFYLWKKDQNHYRILCETFIALGLIFTTLTIPFALDGRLTAATWAIEGAGFIWIGLRQDRKLLMFFGLAIQVIGGALFFLDAPYETSNFIFANTHYLGIVIVSLAALFTAFCLDHFKTKDLLKFKLDIMFIIYGLIWWFTGGLLEFEYHLNSNYILAASIIYISLSVTALLFSMFLLNWTKLKFAPWLLSATLPIFLLISAIQTHIFPYFTYFAWSFSFLVCYLCLYLSDTKNVKLLATPALHIVNLLTLTAILGFELFLVVNTFIEGEAWSISVAGLTLICTLYFCISWKKWPVKLHQKAYGETSVYILLATLAIWSITLNYLRFANPAPLDYLPLLNPIDITQTLIFIALFSWVKSNASNNILLVPLKPIYGVTGLFIFAWFNSMLLKTLHSQLDIPYESQALFDSSIVHMSVSISWSLIGLGIMIIASKKVWRTVWIVGAALSAVVVVKLFLLDLSGRETVERIVSFLIVGALLLVVGYFSPVPPKRKTIDKPYEASTSPQSEGNNDNPNNTDDTGAS